MKTINVNRDAQSIELTISLPFSASKRCLVKNGNAIIDAFKMLLLEAIEARMEACYNNLQSHLSNVISADEYCIVYSRENGTTHSFNIPSYRAMEECRKTLMTMDTDTILRKISENPQWAEQLCKALYWVDNKNDRNGQCFGDLISFLMECAICGSRGARYEA